MYIEYRRRKRLRFYRGVFIHGSGYIYAAHHCYIHIVRLDFQGCAFAFRLAISGGRFFASFFRCSRACIKLRFKVVCARFRANFSESESIDVYIPIYIYTCRKKSSCSNTQLIEERLRNVSPCPTRST